MVFFDFAFLINRDSVVYFSCGCNHRFLREILVGAAKVVEQLELLIFVEGHHAMAHVAHVLLDSFRMSELGVTVEADLAQLDALRHVGKQAFQVDEALDVQNREVVLVPHVVQVFLDTRGLIVTEEADSE